MHIVTAKEMYEADRYAIEKIGIDGRMLMENAGREAASKIQSRITEETAVLVLVGAGNNGGDGFVIARTMANNGYRVTLLQLVPDHKIKGDAAFHKQLFVKSGGDICYWQGVDSFKALLKDFGVVIDAMLGIGVSGPLRSPFDEAVEAVNEMEILTIAVDIPSGVPADEGVAEFDGIQADRTIVIEQPKVSAYLQHTAPYYGELEIVRIGIPHQAFRSSIQLWGEKEAGKSLPDRDRFSHKGSHGKGLVIGGAREMPGSISLTTRAALKAGSGLITTATVQEVIPVLSSTCLEATYLLLQEKQGRIDDQQIDVSAFDALAIGMGMGREPHTSNFTKNLLLKADIPVLIDADGLHHAKENISLLKNRKKPTVLTPHPGEMAMLTGYSVKEILQKPFSVSREFAVEHQVYLVLKGSNTIVADPEGNQWVNTSGNAGLAKGGTGDVLSGILLAMIMQKQTIQEALSNGCFIHGKSADDAVRDSHSQQDLLASDVIDGLASVFRTFS
ncbi:bifunctional ADP-dependent NAD(P)H-hydrate dehydratase/NAD(P)H-hydrate epimerase [Sediminibacillus massiliensis]|uniref:bifunctional ADP-dependent NAD(P)H-hydrate dehydratase/NAD(P)H-hydrate epimerase n=1 Tax=Sediminibacillus massiliensis TaxID=1926277 RepID=UPI0009884B9B|nr:bifunctional ADP-dependent NAD(P)H-hydrate dehydratase/NAD(P)H-hydrate epimerase [Sediminibacillus massiliensis]